MAARHCSWAEGESLAHCYPGEILLGSSARYTIEWTVESELPEEAVEEKDIVSF